MKIARIRSECTWCNCLVSVTGDCKFYAHKNKHGTCGGSGQVSPQITELFNLAEATRAMVRAARALETVDHGLVTLYVERYDTAKQAFHAAYEMVLDREVKAQRLWAAHLHDDTKRMYTYANDTRRTCFYIHSDQVVRDVMGRKNMGLEYDELLAEHAASRRALNLGVRF